MASWIPSHLTSTENSNLRAAIAGVDDPPQTDLSSGTSDWATTEFTEEEFDTVHLLAETAEEGEARTALLGVLDSIGDSRRP